MYSKERLRAIKYAVEANHFETTALWKEYHQSRKAIFDSEQSGTMANLGTLDSMPVCVEYRIIKINGHDTLFYSGTSKVIDYRKIEAWVDETFPNLEINTDAQNFHLIILDSRKVEKVVD